MICVYLCVCIYIYTCKFSIYIYIMYIRSIHTINPNFLFWKSLLLALCLAVTWFQVALTLQRVFRETRFKERAEEVSRGIKEQ